jgi:hypothetical protein
LLPSKVVKTDPDITGLPVLSKVKSKSNLKTNLSQKREMTGKIVDEIDPGFFLGWHVCGL